MASHEYTRHPLPAPPSQEQQYTHISYDQSPLPQRPQAAQQYQPRQQQSSYSQQEQSQQPQKPERQRPRSRGFSFRSDKSHKTEKSEGKGHAYKISSGALHETHAEKEQNRLATKADPTLAMNELEPSAVARAAINFDEKPPLSALQHKDATGVVITEPDRSNPTRSKWERPLDTIRSFEAAYDGGSSSRQSVYRSDSDSVANWNRRSSYYGNSNGPRFPHESYYGARSNTNLARESAMLDPRGPAMGGPRGDEYFEGFDGAANGRNGGNGPRNRNARVQADPSMSTHPAVNRGVFQSPNNHKSYETVASGSGSASYGEPSGYQTDPTSSENSSINRRASPPKRYQEPRNDYGISFGQTPSYQPPSLGPDASHPRTMPDNSHAPAPPPKGSGTLLKKGSAAAPQRPDMGEKRKSRLSRLFGKSS
ncbi:hypothetical protein TruAng_007212 [Truncatella angustata]|nr:hypothetical protein TruAng_007212 [Truncatella angustata]